MEVVNHLTNGWSHWIKFNITLIFLLEFLSNSQGNLLNGIENSSGATQSGTREVEALGQQALSSLKLII